MATTKTTKPAKDGTGTAYTQAMATEGIAADLTPLFYLAEPTGETIIAPATSTKQPALGTAGTASADVLSVQGIASMTPVKVDGSAVTQPVSGTITANLGTIAGTATAANQASQLTQETTTATALGTPADAAWVSGSGSVIALLKKIGGGSAVTIADGADVTQGSLADVAWAGSGSSSVVAALKAIYAKVAGIIGVSQSGTWTVQPGNTANTTAWKVDGSAVTQPISGTITANLGTINGAATAAKQPALGIAGTPSADVISVQGITSGTALPVSGTLGATQSGTWTVQPGNTANTTAWKVDGSAVTQPVSGTVTANLGTIAGVATAAKQPALGTAGAASADVISVQGIAGGTAQPVTGTFFQATQPVSAAALPLPAGASTAAKQPALGTAGAASADVLSIQGIAGGTTLPVTATQTGTWTVQPGNTANTTAWKVDGSAVTQPVSVATAFPILGRTTMTIVTPTVTSNGAYSAGNEIGGLMTFPIGGAGTGGELKHMRVTSKTGALTTALTAFVFTANPSSSTWTDKTNPAINTADIASILCQVELNFPTSALGTMTLWSATSIGAQFLAANLYVALVTTSAITLTSTSVSDITVELGMRVD